MSKPKDYFTKSVPSAKRPLNWKEPKLEERVEKTLTWEEKVNIHSRHGTPFTRRGVSFGAKPLQPPISPDLFPPLILGKALLHPVKEDAAGRKQQLGRKRDEHGKFAQAGASKKESSAQQDAEEQERAAKLSAAKQHEKLTPDFKPAAAGYKFTNRKYDTKKGLDQANMEGSPGKMMGQTQSGMPIYDDPYHPEHEQFSADDHMDAANLHQQASQQSQDPLGSALSAQNSQIHGQLAQSQQSPTARFMQNKQPQEPQNQGSKMPMSPDGQVSNMFQEPQVGQNPSIGPKPGMNDTRTGLPVGPQTDQSGQGGTVPQLETENPTMGMDSESPNADYDPSAWAPDMSYFDALFAPPGQGGAKLQSEMPMDTNTVGSEMASPDNNQEQDQNQEGKEMSSKNRDSEDFPHAEPDGDEGSSPSQLGDEDSDEPSNQFVSDEDKKSPITKALQDWLSNQW